MTQGQYPTILAGQTLTASLLQSLAPLEAWKTSATTRSTLTLAIDADLQLSLAASATYEVRAGLIYQAASGGLSFAWTLPASSDGGYVASFNNQGSGTPGVGTYGLAWSATGSAGTTSGSITYAVKLSGTLWTGSAGTFGVQWASAAGPASLTLGKGSYLAARRIA